MVGTPSENGAGVVAVATYTCPGSSPNSHAIYLLDSRHPVANPPYLPNAPVLKTIPLGASNTFAQPTFAEGKLFVASTTAGLMAYGP